MFMKNPFYKTNVSFIRIVVNLFLVVKIILCSIVHFCGWILFICIHLNNKTVSTGVAATLLRAGLILGAIQGGGIIYYYECRPSL